jgi:phosphatidate cytidylyltransferase
MLKTRLLTALIGIPFVLLLVWLGGAFYSAVVMLLALLAMRELIVTSRHSETPVSGGWAYVLLLCNFFLLTAVIWGLHQQLAMLWILPVLILAGAVLGYSGSYQLSLASLAVTFLAAAYATLFAFLILLRGFPVWGAALTWAALLAVWSGDSAAYFVGKAIGRKRLSALSPGKTVEGTIGGIVAGLIIGAIAAHVGGLDWRFAFAVGALASLTAPIGDLVASYWKRELKVKDFGTIFPGHGGVLDRCDSLIFAVFAVYLFATWVL